MCSVSGLRSFIQNLEYIIWNVHTKDSPLGVTQEPRKRQTRPQWVLCFGVFFIDYCKDSVSLIDEICYLLMPLIIIIIIFFLILGSFKLLIFYIRHFVGQLCGAQRPFGLVVGSIAPSVKNCSIPAERQLPPTLLGL